MLAQNFKTPAELRITDAAFDALLKVLNALEREELVHVDVTKPWQVKSAFNMSLTRIDCDCGTVACILGWARIFARDDNVLKTVTMFNANNDALLETLMFTRDPPKYFQRWNRPAVTSAQAAAGLRNYLTHGEPRWSEVLEYPT